MLTPEPQSKPRWLRSVEICSNWQKPISTDVRTIADENLFKSVHIVRVHKRCINSPAEVGWAMMNLSWKIIGLNEISCDIIAHLNGKSFLTFILVWYKQIPVYLYLNQTSNFPVGAPSTHCATWTGPPIPFMSPGLNSSVTACLPSYGSLLPAFLTWISEFGSNDVWPCTIVASCGAMCIFVLVLN